MAFIITQTISSNNLQLLLHVNSWDILIQLVFISYYSSIIIYYVGAIIDTSDKFGVGNGPIVYSHVDCVGNEKRLSHCNRHQQSDHQACSSRSAGIVGLKCLESKLARSIYLYVMSNML